MFAVGTFASPAVHAQTGPFVSADFALKPSAIPVGGSFRLLFVTTQETDATSTAIDTYNTFVQTSADGGHSAIQTFSGEFSALISTATVDASANTATTGTGVPIYWLNGDKVADDYTNFYDGMGWDSVAGTDESGSIISGFPLIATGSESDGTKHATDFAGATNVRYGRLQENRGEINDAKTLGTSSIFVLYALSPIITVTPPSPTFGAATIPPQTYPINTATAFSFTLPTASGGLGTLIYTLPRMDGGTPLPTGMSFDADAVPPTISGTPTQEGFGGSGAGGAELLYTVTDAASQTDTLSFIVKTVVVTVDTDAGETVGYVDRAIAASNIGGGDNNNDMRLILPINAVSGIAVTFYDLTADAVPSPPDGVTFSGVAMEIDLAFHGSFRSLPTDTTATVCLSTAGVPGGSAAVYHLPTATPTEWEETDPPVRTIPGFVCGATDDFSPFAVGYNQIASRLSAVSQTILPEVARAITDTTVNAITQRLEQAGVDSHQPGAFTLAGQSTLADILTTGGQSLAAGTLNLHDVLGRSAFVMPLTMGGDLAKNLTLWGGGDYRNIGGSGGAVDWDGELFSARLGADAQVSDTVLAGAALSWTDGDFEYGELAGEPGSGGGDYSLEMTSIAPYVGWSVLPGGRLNLWATAGYGWGEVAITDTVAQNAETIEDTQTSEATLKLAGGGVSARILDSGMGHVRLKGEIMQTSMELEGRDFIEALTVEARRARFSVAAGKTYTSADGARLTPTVEVGLRHDAGDGRTGTGAEVGGELSYTDPYNWLTLDTQGRVLLGHNGGYDDWGIGAIFTLKPTPGGQGLALRLTPTYGQTVTNTAQLWNQSAAALTGTDAAALGQRMNAEVGYGLALADGQSLLTPYGNMTWGQRTRAYRLGSRLTLASGLNLSLESRRGETLGAAVDHGVLVNVEWGW